MAKQKTMKLSKKRAGITIGIGLTCAAVAVAPVVGQYLSNNSYASGAGYNKGVCSLAEGSQSLLEDMSNVYTAIENLFFNKSNTTALVARRLIYQIRSVEQPSETQRINNIRDLVNDNDPKWGSYNLAEAVEIAKSSPEYETNEELKDVIQIAELYLNNQLNSFHIDYTNMSMSLIEAAKYLDPSFTLDSTATYIEQIQSVKSLSAYEKYVQIMSVIENDSRLLDNACTDSENSTRDVSKDEMYTLLRQRIANIKELDPSFTVKLSIDPENTPSTGDDDKKDEEEKPSVPTTPTTPAKPNTDKLQSVIDQIKADSTYQKWYRLIKLVEEAERLLEDLKGAGLGAVEPQQIVDQPYVANAIQARTASIVLAAETTTPTQDLANTIKAIGDAMRDLGIETTLGQGLGDSVTQEELAAAISTAKGTAKYTEYAELVRIMEEAETAIKNGTADDKLLGNLTKALADTAKKLNLDVKIPSTGILGILGDSGATASILGIAGTASILTIIAGVILHRKKKNQKDFIV